MHNADRTNPPFPLGGTLLGGLAYGVAEAWDKLSLEAAGAVTAFGVLPLLDLWRGTYTGPLPHSEVIITTAITKDGELVPRSYDSHTFYINDRDWHHYSLPLVQKTYAVVDR
jgi:hypothetical protein